MADGSAELHVAQVENTRLLAAYVLGALALSLWGAAGVELVLMVLAWIRSAFMHGGTGDFPGRYWFVVLPLVTAAAVLQVRGRGLRKPR